MNSYDIKSMESYYNEVGNVFKIDKTDKKAHNKTHQLNNNLAKRITELVTLNEDAKKYLIDDCHIMYKSGKGNRLVSREKIIEICYILNNNYECKITGEIASLLLASAGYHKLHAREIPEICYRWGLDKKLTLAEVEALIDELSEYRNPSDKKKTDGPESTFFLNLYAENNNSLEAFKKFIISKKDDFDDTIQKTYNFVNNNIFTNDERSTARNFFEFYSEFIRFDLKEYYSGIEKPKDIAVAEQYLLQYTGALSDNYAEQQICSGYLDYNDYFTVNQSIQILDNINDIIRKDRNISRTGFVLLIIYAWEKVDKFKRTYEKLDEDTLDMMLNKCRFDMLNPNNIYFDNFICRCFDVYKKAKGEMKLSQIICEYCRYAYYHKLIVPIRGQICARVRNT